MPRALAALLGASLVALWLIASASAAPQAAGNAALAVVNYQLDDRLIHVPVRLNGMDLWFDVDTGARHSVIDAATARRLRLTVLRTGSIGGTGKGSAALQHAAPVEIAVGAAHLRVEDPWILDLKHVGTTRHIDGLIGEDFFNAYVIRIDPVTQTLAFYEPETFRYVGAGATIPLASPNGRLFISMRLSLANGVSAFHRVRIDTGSDDAVSDDLVRQSPTRRKSLQGIGLGKPYVDYSGVFASVQIGPYRIHEVWGPSGNPPAVGMEVLRRFILTFDVRHDQLSLQPTAHLNDPVPSPAPQPS